MFDNLVQEELEKVRKKVPPFNSWYTVYGILREEIFEFQEECFKKSRNRDHKNALKELVQIAGICLRSQQDLKELETNQNTHHILTKDNSFAESLGKIFSHFHHIEKDMFESGEDVWICFHLSCLYYCCKNAAISLGLVNE